MARSGGALVLVLLCGAGLHAWQSDAVDPAVAAEWRATLESQQQELATIRRESDRMVGALTRRFADLQGRLVRMEALGKRMMTVADLDLDEFDFSQPPAVGGPDDSELESPVPVVVPDFVAMVEQLSEQILTRQQQLDALNGLIHDRQFFADLQLTGRPVDKGWQSSGFGRRVDPFSGQMAFHSGLDFAAPKGSKVRAVAGGVVVFSGRRGAYGNLVEINHGNGYSTRYAHSNQNLVAVGDVVRKGDVIATVGSSGRATGPHVHFEVLKDGRSVDPARYVARRSG
ncbi:MAG: M23 family metallopeptidase [Gammaproteobacteria bacterium]|nr:M23 family metallopeptidase [Gammaproteobacteria bacterium]